MRGLIFTEFLEMIEARHGLQRVDAIIEASNPPSGGSYTSVADYDHKELIGLVRAQARMNEETPSTVLKNFGLHVFARLATAFSDLVAPYRSTFVLLENLDEVIHQEVQKLYPTAQLPKFAASRNADELVIRYASPRCLEDFAEGLLLACISHFGEHIVLFRKDHGPEDGWRTTFTLKMSRDGQGD